MLRVFLILFFFPIVALADSLLVAIQKQALVEAQKVCDSCTIDIYLNENPEINAQEIKSISAPHWRGNTVFYVRSKDQVYQISGQVRWKDKLVIASKNIRHGEKIKKDHLKLVEKDITFNKLPYLKDLSSIENYIARRSFVLGQIIDGNSIKKAKAVRYGQQVKVHLDRGLLSMTVSGKARSSGAVGDLIPVYIGKTRRKITAKVIDKNNVRME